MKYTPIQLIETRLMKVAVEPIFSQSEDGSVEEDEADIDIEHFSEIELVPTQGSDQASEAEDENERRTFFVTLGVRTPEQSPKNLKYSFEVIVAGMIKVDPIKEKTKEQICNMAAQYGYSLLYGQIRETLANLTSRMTHGTFIVPTVSFMDARYGDDEVQRVKADAQLN